MEDHQIVLQINVSRMARHAAAVLAIATLDRVQQWIINANTSMVPRVQLVTQVVSRIIIPEGTFMEIVVAQQLQANMCLAMLAKYFAAHYNVLTQEVPYHQILMVLEA